MDIKISYVVNTSKELHNTSNTTVSEVILSQRTFFLSVTDSIPFCGERKKESLLEAEITIFKKNNKKHLPGHCLQSSLSHLYCDSSKPPLDGDN